MAKAIAQNGNARLFVFGGRFQPAHVRPVALCAVHLEPVDPRLVPAGLVVDDEDLERVDRLEPDEAELDQGLAEEVVARQDLFVSRLVGLVVVASQLHDIGRWSSGCGPLRPRSRAWSG